MSQSDKPTENAPTIASTRRLIVAVAALLLTGLFFVLYAWVSGETFGHDVWAAFVLEHYGLIVGLPMAAALSFGIVVAFQQTSDEPLSIKMGPLEITGPAGPILLWVVCLLALTLAIKTLEGS